MDLVTDKLVEVYNTVGDKITILYQWDINQILYLKINADNVLSNSYISINHKNKYQIPVTLNNDGYAIVKIPNALMQSDKTLYIETHGYTVQIPIKKEPKPYVYEYMNEIQGQLTKRMVQATISETEEYIKANSTVIGT